MFYQCYKATTAGNSIPALRKLLSVRHLLHHQQVKSKAKQNSSAAQPCMSLIAAFDKLVGCTGPPPEPSP